MFFEALKWQCTKQGKHLEKIDRYFASSQTCSSCGKKQRMPLNQRTYHCVSCDTSIDRDLNAAINIQAKGTTSYIGQGLSKFTPVRYYDSNILDSAQEAVGSVDPQ